SSFARACRQADPQWPAPYVDGVVSIEVKTVEESAGGGVTHALGSIAPRGQNPAVNDRLRCRLISQRGNWDRAKSRDFALPTPPDVRSMSGGSVNYVVRGCVGLRREPSRVNQRRRQCDHKIFGGVYAPSWALGWVGFMILCSPVANVAAAEKKHPNSIRVLEATYGGNCEGVAKGNVTKFVASAC